MKIPVIKTAIMSLMLALVISSCNNPSAKVEEAQKDVIDANRELDEANVEYLREIDNFRVETAIKIEANNKTIADYKVLVQEGKSSLKQEREKKIAELEMKNSNMKMRLDDYKADGKDKWNTFKSEFNHDMEEMGKAFKDLTTDNVK
jgi:hypothetical protein